jgi:hypothetical protein
MLRAFGHPLVVAGRYRGHQYLIGPAVYPFYLHALKIVLATGAALLVGLATLSLVLGGNEIAGAILHVAGGLWSFLFLAIALVTLVFAILERRGFPAEHLGQWMPERLPDATDRPQSQWQSALEVGLGIAFILWWTGVVTLPAVARGGAMIEPAPVWAHFYLPVLLLALVQLAIHVMKWVRPRWTRAASVLTILLAILTLALVAALQPAGSWVVASPSAGRGDAAQRIAESVNLAIRIAFVVVALTMVVQLLGELWKLVRPRLQRASGGRA